MRDSPAPLDAYAEREQGTSAPAEARTRRKRILFVDDEPDLLDSLRDALRKYRKVWRISFATGGEAALANLASEPTDVIVCDMQMPGMDGATLLSDVQDRHPDTIRIVLSGYANPLVVARAATAAHRFLAKPCNLEELGLLIERSCALHDMTKEAEVYRLTAAATSLPSRPGLYPDIAQVIADPTTGPDDIARVIERDTAMTAKVLQLANSAFFGHGRTVTRVREAVVYLGADTIKSLTLTAEAFGKLRPSGIDAFAFNEFQRHATLVARIAARLLPEGAAQQEAVTAALLHDIGKLVPIADDPQRWQRMGQEGARRQRSVYELEKEQEGVTHAATRAYLLTLWGLPAGVVDAVAHHHEPSGVAALDLDPVGAVHIANALAHEVYWATPAVHRRRRSIRTTSSASSSSHGWSAGASSPRAGRPRRRRRAPRSPPAGRSSPPRARTPPRSAGGPPSTPSMTAGRRACRRARRPAPEGMRASRRRRERPCPAARACRAESAQSLRHSARARSAARWNPQVNSSTRGGS